MKISLSLSSLIFFVSCKFKRLFTKWTEGSWQQVLHRGNVKEEEQNEAIGDEEVLCLLGFSFFIERALNTELRLATSSLCYFRNNIK